MINYAIADGKRPNRYYYGIGTTVSTNPKDKGILLSLKDSHSMSETRAYIPIGELDNFINNLLKHKKELQ
jgi:hypothetical protein